MAEALTPPDSVGDDSLDSMERIKEVDPDIEKRVVRKCDWWVVPAPTVMFMLSFIDR
jgi:hypothetical protein